MKTKEYFSEDIDFFKLQVINGNIKAPKKGNIQKRIRNTIILLTLFKDEITWWFNLLEIDKIKTLYSRNYIRKPVCIELLEYAYLLKWFIKNINDNDYNLIHFINNIFVNKGREAPLKIINKNYRKDLNIIIKTLEPFRNKIAAHRYFNKDGNYILINDIIEITNKVSFDKLMMFKESLFEVHDKIVEWFRVNEKFLILSDYD